LSKKEADCNAKFQGQFFTTSLFCNRRLGVTDDWTHLKLLQSIHTNINDKIESFAIIFYIRQQTPR